MKLKEDSMKRLLVFAVVAMVLWHPFAWAEIPHLIRYQGQAVDSNGVPLEGPYTLAFRLYDAETNGNLVWEETQTDVPLSGGHFSILLGQVTPLTTMDWSQPRWLAVQVNAEPELLPRQRITSVPLAITAERLAVAVTTSTISDDANRLVPIGAIVLWDGVSCPAGYSRLAGYDGKFLVGSDTAGQTGGSNTHTHGAGSYTQPAHQHDQTVGSRTGSPSVQTQADAPFGTGQTLNAVIGDSNSGNEPFKAHKVSPGGDDPITGTSGSADNRPEFMTILLCQKD